MRLERGPNNLEDSGQRAANEQGSQDWALEGGLVQLHHCVLETVLIDRMWNEWYA